MVILTELADEPCPSSSSELLESGGAHGRLLVAGAVACTMRPSPYQRVEKAASGEHTHAISYVNRSSTAHQICVPCLLWMPYLTISGRGLVRGGYRTHAADLITPLQPWLLEAARRFRLPLVAGDVRHAAERDLEGATGETLQEGQAEGGLRNEHALKSARCAQREKGGGGTDNEQLMGTSTNSSTKENAIN